MYHYDGLLFQIVYPGLALLGLSIIFLILIFVFKGKFKGRQKQLIAYNIVAILFSLFCIIKVGSSILSPEVNTYTGEFSSSYRASRISPYTHEYRFGPENDQKYFYIDNFSKDNFLEDFEVGEKYTIYYKKGLTVDIIIAVEKVEP